MKNSDHHSFLERAAQAHEQRRSEMRIKRKRAKQQRPRTELKAERENAPWRYYLREWRLEKGMSLHDLSKATGVTKEMISRYEAYKRGLSYDVSYRLVAALGITPPLLFYPPNSDMALSLSRMS